MKFSQSFVLSLFTLIFGFIPLSFTSADQDISQNHPSPSSYFLTENIVGTGFYDHFNFEAIADPTHGRVYVLQPIALSYRPFISRTYMRPSRTYVDKRTAILKNLTYAGFDSFVLRTDAKTVLSPTGPGRDSVRIISKKAYTTHVAV